MTPAWSEQTCAHYIHPAQVWKPLAAVSYTVTWSPAVEGSKHMMRDGFRLFPGIVLAVSAAAALGAQATSYTDEIRQWREQREAKLKADGGWLTVAGLFWLKEGTNRFGTDPSNEIVLPEGSAPPRAGAFEFHGGKTTVRMEAGAPAAVVGEKPVVGVVELASDSTGSPDVLTMGRLTMHVIMRGDRFGIRLKNMQSKLRDEFTGLHWYPVKESFRVTARFVPHETPRQISVPNILGMVEKMPSPGYAVFTLEGQEVHLDPVLEEPNATQLFFIFRDGTTGKETYPAGRFLYADMPKDGQIVLDFNKAYNPPCAFTPYATCPLPPEQNRLAVAIEAGELNYGHH